MSASESDLNDWWEVGDATAVPEDGAARSFNLGARKVCVVSAAGRLYAIADLCTHGHALLSEGYCDIAGGVIECPLHGGLFDFRTGAAVGAPAEKAAEAFEVKVAQDRLYLRASGD